MQTTIITLKETDYLKVELVEVEQKNKFFYIAKINARDFIKIHTVRPAKYDIIKHTQLANSFPSEREYHKSRMRSHSKE